MKRKPRVGEKLRLLALAQKSRAGFSVPVVCVDAWDRDDSLNGMRPLARKCTVVVRLPDGATVDVTRDDVDPDD